MSAVGTAFSAVLAVVCLPAAVFAQDRSPPSPSPWSTEIHMLVGPGPPEGYVVPDCRSGFTAGGALRLPRKIHRNAEASADFSYLTDMSGTSCAIDFTSPPEPFNEFSIQGAEFPRFTPALELSVGPDWPDRMVTIRVTGGGGYAFGTEQGFLAAGGSILLGRRTDLHLSIGYERWFLSAPVRTVYRQVVGTTVVAKESTVRDWEGDLHMFRIGVVFPQR